MKSFLGFRSTQLQQGSCSSGPALRAPRSAPKGVPRLPQVPNVASLERASPKVHSNKQVRFFYFDPLNPEEVREVVAKQQAEAKGQPHVSSNGNGNGHHASNNGHSHAFTANGHSSNGVALANGNGHAQLVHNKDNRENLLQLQRLTNQLEEARGAIAKLQQYEVLYKESRMRSKQMQSEVHTLQALIADKDQELARQYKRMEVEASERSGLRSQFTTAVDEVKALRNELEEARQAMLELRGVIPVNVTLRRGQAQGSRSLSGSSGSAVDEGEASAPDVLGSLQGLARQLAEGMEQEVGSLFGGGHHHSHNGK